MNPQDYKGYIFDVDGTLYTQKKVRIHMAARLISAVICGDLCVKDVQSILCFRKLRDKTEYANCTVEELYVNVSDQLNIPGKQIAVLIDKWMFQNPLDLLDRYRYANVIAFLNNQYKEGKYVAIYSDYPAKAKLQAMGVGYTAEFVSGMKGTESQKPSKPAMEYILSKANILAKDMLYVGDRDDKDRSSAEMAGMAYCDIREFRKLI